MLESYCFFIAGGRVLQAFVKNEVLRESNSNVNHIISKSLLIDPCSMNFLNSVKYFKNNIALPPTFLIKNAKNPYYFMRRGRKYAYAFDSLGFFKGTLFFDHGSGVVNYMSAKTNTKHAEHFVNMKQVEKRLVEEELVYDEKFEKHWNQWIKTITSIRGIIIKIKSLLS